MSKSLQSSSDRRNWSHPHLRNRSSLLWISPNIKANRQLRSTKHSRLNCRCRSGRRKVYSLSRPNCSPKWLRKKKMLPVSHLKQNVKRMNYSLSYRNSVCGKSQWFVGRWTRCSLQSKKLTASTRINSCKSKN